MDIGEELEVIEIRPEPLPDDDTDRWQDPDVTEREHPVEAPAEVPELVPA